MSRSLRLRLVLLLCANGALLLRLATLLREGTTLTEVLAVALTNLGPPLFCALGLTGIIWTGALDLSVGSIVAVAASVFGVLVQHEVSPFLAFAGCVLTCVGLAGLNGAVSHWLRIPPILWTLGARAIYRGLALILANVAIPRWSGNISIAEEAYHAPGKLYAGPILFLGVGLAIAWERWGKTPRLWLALGGSEEACRLQGLAAGRLLVGAFTCGGFFLGLSALLLVTQVQAIEPARLAQGIELSAIGAVVLGGTNIFGGEGSYLGTLLGAVFLYLLGQILVFENVSVYWRELVSGGAIVLVIGLDCLLTRRRRRLEELQ